MTKQKITMDGKWAYRGDPYTQVRVLCVDRPGKRPVLSLDGDAVIAHDQYGNTITIKDYNLVPLKVKREPREVWRSTTGNMILVNVDSSTPRPPKGTLIFREVIEGEE
jgi:hypothetical protein